MYEAFYGLKEKPFNLTPDPRFLYLSEKHKEAFAHLLFGIKHRCGFIMVTGEIGTGKTTICRTLLNQLDENTEVAFIFNPCLSPEELLRTINEDFGIESRAATVKDLIDELNQYLLDRNAKGKNCVLVIDEAQDLKPGVLEQIRLLSNLETETQKLLQIVLIGQPELMHTLALPELRQLNQRITARYHLTSLDEEETLQYIAYRLRVAGGRRKVQFAARSVHAVYRASGGTPRVINAVCDRALLIGYTQEVRDITARIVKRAAKEVRGERVRSARQSPWRRYVPSPMLLGAMILIVLAGIFLVEPLAGMFPAIQMTAIPSQGAAPVHSTTDAEPGKVDAMVNSPKEAPLKSVAPPPVSDPLVGMLDGLNPDISRNAAAIGILRAWDMALLGGYPENDSVESLTAFAQQNGLEATSTTWSLEQLAEIDLPAFVWLAGDRQALWVGLLGMTPEKEVRITTSVGSDVAVPIESFKGRYLKRAVVFWQDYAPQDKPLKLSQQGEQVRVLQAQLRAVGLLAVEPSGTYDDATVEAVKTLQSRTGLNADGVAGKQTRMVLGSWLPGFASPSLRGKVEASEKPNLEAPAPAPPVSGTPVSGAPAPAAPAADTGAAQAKPEEKPAAGTPNAPAQVTPLPQLDVRLPGEENSVQAATPSAGDADSNAENQNAPAPKSEESQKADKVSKVDDTMPRVNREELAAPNPYVSTGQIRWQTVKAATNPASGASPLVPHDEMTPKLDSAGAAVAADNAAPRETAL